jgi:hypothetical protein
LEAESSPGDNDGISAYNIEVVGTAVAGHQECPLTSVAGIAVFGFTIGGSDIPPGALFAGMNSTEPASIYYGVGSPEIGGRIAEPFADPALDHRQVPWPTPVLLAEGTAGDLNSMDFGAETGVNVWAYGQAEVGGVDAEAADVITMVTRVALPDCNTNGVPDSHEVFYDGDFDADGDTDLADFVSFADCLSGPNSAPDPLSPECVGTCRAAFDLDADDDIDLLDFAEFQEAFTGS